MSGQWYYRRGKLIVGPITVTELKYLATQGDIQPSDQLRKGADGPWLPAKNHASLFASVKPAQQGSSQPQAIGRVGETALVGRDAKIDAILATSRGTGDKTSQQEAPFVATLAPPTKQRSSRWALYAALSMAASLVIALLSLSGWLVLRSSASAPQRTSTNKPTSTFTSQPPEREPEAEQVLPAPLKHDKKRDPDEWFPQVAPAVPLIVCGNSTGSGFLLEHAGNLLIVTNNHVTEDPPLRGISFVKTDDQTAEVIGSLSVPLDKAKILAHHPAADLSVIQIVDFREELKRHGVTPLSLARPEELPRPGGHVFAIGHPGGSSGDLKLLNITAGVVSRRREMLPEIGTVMITDTSINRGNSGGPLFDFYGRIVGVNVAADKRLKPIFNAEGKIEDLDILTGINYAIETPQVWELLEMVTNH